MFRVALLPCSHSFILPLSYLSLYLSGVLLLVALPAQLHLSPSIEPSLLFFPRELALMGRTSSCYLVSHLGFLLVSAQGNML